MKDKTARALIQKVEQVLWNDWDPIGLNTGDEFSAPNDEYNSYAPSFAKLLDEGADAYKISNRLGQIAEGSIGLRANPEHSAQVANILLSLVKEKF